MSDREAFEDWFGDYCHERNWYPLMDRDDDAYVDSEVEMAWQAWQVGWEKFEWLKSARDRTWVTVESQAKRITELKEALKMVESKMALRPVYDCQISLSEAEQDMIYEALRNG